MPPITRSATAFSLALLSLSSFAFAHDGDPKMRDRRPRVQAGGSGGDQVALAAEDFSFPASNVQLLSWITLRDIGHQHESGNSCFGYVSPSGREYAVIGTSRATVFVDVTDPGQAVVKAMVIGPDSLWRDMKVFGNYCYSISEGGEGIQVIDLSQLDNGFATLVNTVTAGGALATHTLVLNAQSGHLYRCGGQNNGLRIYSLADPANPTYVGQWSARYVHEAQVVTYTSGPYAGREIAFCCAGYNGGFDQTALDIVDVTNKSAPFLVKRFFYSNAQYSHQGWLTEDKRYFYLDDELDDTGAQPVRTRVIDVTSLSNPVELTSFSTGSTAIDHNQYVRGNRIYQANYRSGLHVWDCSTPTAPVHIGSFDTWPEDEGAQFNGLWNNYPFLPSGIVIGSDIEKGLFVWKVGEADVDFGFVHGVPSVVHPAGEGVPLNLVRSPGTTIEAGSAKLHVDTGSGWASYDLVGLGGDAYQAPFPASPCGSDVAWYVTARTSAGTTWSYPQGAPRIVRHAVSGTSVSIVSLDRMDATTTWTVDPADTATSGRWQRANPLGTQAAPDDDHSKLGVACWFTGQGTGLGNANEADVDGGTTTLVSPTYDLSSLGDPVISYWRWYSTNVGNPTVEDDAFVVEISNDGGASWNLVEQVGPGGPGTTGGWILHQFRVRDLVAPTSQIKLRFVASDTGVGSTVEAAIDDLAIGDVGCASSDPVAYCTAKTNSQGCVPQIGSSGVATPSGSQPFLVTASNVLSHKFGVLFYGHGRAAVPFQGALRCVAAPITRTPVQDSLGNPPPVDCSGTFAFDFNALIRAGVDPSLVPGSVVDAQYWYRDPSDPTGFGSGLSDGLEFVIQP